MVGDLFGDQRAALLTGRTQPKKASFRLGRRELILTHETRSQCPWRTCEVSHLLLQFRQLTSAFESSFSMWKISPRNRPVSRYARRDRFASRITHSHQRSEEHTSELQSRLH